MNEIPIVFKSQGRDLIGIVHLPDTQAGKTGVFIATGGPQTRVGSHRQFVLLARYLAKNGIPVFRFDYTGMGDSAGEKTEFLQACPDLDAAIECFFSCAEIESFAYWGLCDAASLGLMYLAVKDEPRLTRFIALNPWVRQSHTEAQAYLKSYYLKRLANREFWSKVVTFRYDFLGSM